MKKTFKLLTLVGLSILLNGSLFAQGKNNQKQKTKMETKMKQVLIDKITVPSIVKEEFIKRMNTNIEILKKQKGFVKHDTYEQQIDTNNFVFVTVVEWEDAEAINNAKVNVEAEYQRTGFNLKEFCQKNNINLERNGIYHLLEN
jgi:heme-degrading monooxygenase HmoA